MCACSFGYLHIVKELVAANVNVNVDNGWAFKQACRFGHLEIVRLLISAGANIFANNSRALILASQNDHVEIIKELIKHGADKNIAMSHIKCESIKKEIEEFNPIVRIKKACA